MDSVIVAKQQRKGNDFSCSGFAAKPKFNPVEAFGKSNEKQIASSDLSEQKRTDKRVKWRILNYVKGIIRRSPNGFSCVSQQKLSKMLKIRRQTVGFTLRELVKDEQLDLEVLPNGKRKNPKHVYRLPNASGNPIKSVFRPLSNGEAIEEVQRTQELRIMGLDFWKSSERLDVIDFYLRSGLVVTPLVEEGKLPPKGWTKSYLSTISREKLLETFYRNPDYNIGCWMPSNLICVEVDDLQEFWKLNGQEDYDTLTATSGKDNRCHYYMWHSGNLGSGNGIRQHKDGSSILDYKTNGSLMVLPPSIHKSGRQYEWTNLTEPIDAPDIVHQLYETRENLKAGNPIKSVSLPLSNGETLRDDLKEAKQRNESAILNISEELYQGNRYNRLFRLGRNLRWKRTSDELTQELHSLNRSFCKPALDNKRMEQLILDVKSAKNTKEFSEKLRVKGDN
jgi:hypothetical protein